MHAQQQLYTLSEFLAFFDHGNPAFDGLQYLLQANEHSLHFFKKDGTLVSRIKNGVRKGHTLIVDRFLQCVIHTRDDPTALLAALFRYHDAARTGMCDAHTTEVDARRYVTCGYGYWYSIETTPSLHITDHYAKPSPLDRDVLSLCEHEHVAA